MKPDPKQLTLRSAADALAAGTFTAVELAEALLDRIGRIDSQVQAFLCVDRADVLRQAEASDARRAAGSPLSAYDGIPLTLKDNIAAAGQQCTCASRILEGFISPFDATVTSRLKEAGFVLLGRANMDEFAMGSSCENSAFRKTANPWDLSRVPGGSSGGSAAAVAACETIAALGSDTGGSIRQPASFCGVVGLKPTYGRVSRSGLVAFASSLDQIGPVARDVRDCAALFSVIASHDRKDSTSVELEDYDFMGALKDDVSGLKVGIPNEYFGEGLDPQVKERVLHAAGLLEQRGAQVEHFDLGMLEYAIPAYYVIASAEASSNLERFDGVKYGFRAEEYRGLHDMYKETRSQGFGPEVKRRIMLGSFVLSSGYYDAYYLKALRTKALIKKSFDQAFAKYDVILAPAAPTAAPKLGESLSDPLAMYLGDIYTVSVNLAGLPGISVPCGSTGEGLPVGVQILADCFKEKTDEVFVTVM